MSEIRVAVARPPDAVMNNLLTSLWSDSAIGYLCMLVQSITRVSLKEVVPGLSSYLQSQDGKD